MKKNVKRVEKKDPATGKAFVRHLVPTHGTVGDDGKVTHHPVYQAVTQQAEKDPRFLGGAYSSKNMPTFTDPTTNEKSLIMTDDDFTSVSEGLATALSYNEQNPLVNGLSVQCTLPRRPEGSINVAATLHRADGVERIPHPEEVPSAPTSASSTEPAAIAPSDHQKIDAIFNTTIRTDRSARQARKAEPVAITSGDAAGGEEEAATEAEEKEE